MSFELITVADVIHVSTRPVHCVVKITSERSDTTYNLS